MSLIERKEPELNCLSCGGRARSLCLACGFVSAAIAVDIEALEKQLDEQAEAMVAAGDMYVVVGDDGRKRFGFTPQGEAKMKARQL